MSFSFFEVSVFEVSVFEVSRFYSATISIMILFKMLAKRTVLENDTFISRATSCANLWRHRARPWTVQRPELHVVNKVCQFYKAFHKFGKAKLPNGGSILGSNLNLNP